MELKKLTADQDLKSLFPGLPATWTGTLLDLIKFVRGVCPSKSRLVMDYVTTHEDAVPDVALRLFAHELCMELSRHLWGTRHREELGRHMAAMASSSGAELREKFDSLTRYAENMALSHLDPYFFPDMNRKTLALFAWTLTEWQAGRLALIPKTAVMSAETKKAPDWWSDQITGLKVGDRVEVFSGATYEVVGKPEYFNCNGSVAKVRFMAKVTSDPRDPARVGQIVTVNLNNRGVPVTVTPRPQTSKTAEADLRDRTDLWGIKRDRSAEERAKLIETVRAGKK